MKGTGGGVSSDICIFLLTDVSCRASDRAIHFCTFTFKKSKSLSVCCLHQELYRPPAAYGQCYTLRSINLHRHGTRTEGLNTFGPMSQMSNVGLVCKLDPMNKLVRRPDPVWGQHAGLVCRCSLACQLSSTHWIQMCTDPTCWPDPMHPIQP